MGRYSRDGVRALHRSPEINTRSCPSRTIKKKNESPRTHHNVFTLIYIFLSDKNQITTSPIALPTSLLGNISWLCLRYLSRFREKEGVHPCFGASLPLKNKKNNVIFNFFLFCFCACKFQSRRKIKEIMFCML